MSPAKSGAMGRRRLGNTRLNRGQSKASAQFGVGRRGEKLKPKTLKAQTRGQRTEVRARRGSTEYTAGGKGGPGTGKPDRPKHTIYRGRPYPPDRNLHRSAGKGSMRLSCRGRWLGWFILRHRLRAEREVQAVTDWVRIALAPIMASCGVEVVSCPRLEQPVLRRDTAEGGLAALVCRHIAAF